MLFPKAADREIFLFLQIIPQILVKIVTADNSITQKISELNICISKTSREKLFQC